MAPTKFILFGRLLPLAALLLVSGAAVVAQDIPEGFQQVLLYDDFSTPFTDNWVLDVGIGYPGGATNWGTGEIQTYTDSTDNIAIKNGNLVITPLRDGAGGWTSSLIETKSEHDWVCPPGGRLRVEAKLRLGGESDSAQAGIWPAFWALGSEFRGNDQNWPAIGEIDVLESPNGQPTTWHTVHCGVSPGGPCDETNGVGGSGPFSRGEFHVVSAEISRAASTEGDAWREVYLTFAVDGVPNFTVTGEKIGDLGAWAPLAQEAKFLLLNVAVVVSFPDALAGAQTPNEATIDGVGANMEVKYVAVYST